MNAARVETAQGTVEGDAVAAPDGSTVQRFLGVPYAAAPAGLGRWRRPAAPVTWAGVRPCRSFGPAAPQLAPLQHLLPVFRPTEMAEDCLTVNAWTTSLQGRRPVMVWLHGGAFTTGCSSQPVFDGARLAAEHDVVVVTVNYRIGALGFLCPTDAHPGGDVVANAGLHDQLAALEWVREHAANLGGDPGSITAFGESAGAGSILHLLASTAPPAFDRAIAQSGEPRTLTRGHADEVVHALARAAGVERADSAHLQALPVDAVLAAQGAAAAEVFGSVGVMPFAPVVDEDLLDRDVREALAAGIGRAVPLVLGTTRDELRLFPDPASPGLDEERLRRRVARLVPDSDAEGTVAAYRAQLGGATSAGDVWEAVRTDALMRIPNLLVAEARAAAGAPTFVYRFDWAAPGLGAVHAVDVPFTFGTFAAEGWDAAVGYDPEAETLGVGLRGAWTSFARSGRPSVDGVEAWSVYDDAHPTMLFDRACRVVTDPERAVRGRYG